MIPNVRSNCDEAGRSSPGVDDSKFFDDLETTPSANTERQQISSLQEISYDEFCMRMGGLYDLAKPSEDKDNDEGEFPRTLKTHSFVRNWRRNVDFRVEVGPPVSPLAATEFPSSPVAVIHPSALRMSWKPNYDSVSRMAMCSSPELASPSTIDRPAHFYELYDVDLENLIDEISESQSSVTSDSDTISVYVPPVAAPPVPAPPKQKTFKAAIRWLPKRIKYTLLSTTAGRTLRR
ncbi:hypothetical protein V5O48_010654 [Marasmius crinis-equi]|uniref:Uncharacterized protein n=1 Tax=Marasmius crinis-equi TaxID=585013 RepID=A0ABR3F7R0_9AGAR